MSFVLTPKSPLEVVDRIYDWTPALDDDTITNATLSVTSGTITYSQLEWTPSRILFTISGGAEGETATLLNQITTAGGQTLQQTLSIYIGAEAIQTPFGPSTGTKGDALQLAYEEMGLPGYYFDMSPEEVAMGLRKLDLMMAARPYGDLPLGYNAPATIGGSDINDAIGIADTFLQTIGIALARRNMPAKGKVIFGTTARDYNAGVNALIAQVTAIPQARLKRNTPLGSGDRWWRWRQYAGAPWL